MERIAGILSEKGKIRSNSVGALAKALTLVKINEFIQIELLTKEITQGEEALKQRGNPNQGYGYS